MDAVSPFPQDHGRYTIILGDYQIILPAESHQRKIYCVCPCPNHFYLTVIRMKHMVRIAQ